MTGTKYKQKTHQFGVIKSCGRRLAAPHAAQDLLRCALRQASADPPDGLNVGP
jgi:hypothetical protein